MSKLFQIYDSDLEALEQLLPELHTAAGELLNDPAVRIKFRRVKEVLSNVRHADYDPVFIRRHSNKPLPLPVAPPDLYWRSMYQFQGKRRDDERMALTKQENV
jgi:hypothetical protein